MSYIVTDIETVRHDCAADFIEAPDLNAIQPAGNVKKPELIVESIAQRKAAATAEYETSLSRAALDWNTSRIVCIGIHESGAPAPTAHACHDEAQEAVLLADFWKRTHGRRIVGFSARAFDVPTLIQRSRLLGVSHPPVSLAKYGRGDVIDVRDLLTFDDARYEALMPRSLKTFARRFGLPVDDQTDGKDIAALVAAGDWAGVEAHCLSDVVLTRMLALRINAMPTWKAVAA